MFYKYFKLVSICNTHRFFRIISLSNQSNKKQGFYLYLYAVSLLFLAYVYLYLLHDNPHIARKFSIWNDSDKKIQHSLTLKPLITN